VAILGNHDDSSPPIRLVIVSSKMRNTATIRLALQPNVVFVQYKYYTTTLDGILGK